MLQNFSIYNDTLSKLAEKKMLITTINAHSYNVTQEDEEFNDALLNSDVLIPDGISIVMAIKWLAGKKLKKIAGADLFFHEMKRLEKNRGKCFFLGSNIETLNKIKIRIQKEYKNISVDFFSPPYKKVFSNEDNKIMIQRVNACNPDVLFIGMTAPKQEKWAYKQYSELNVGHICCIGAVFDFYAGTIKRAPKWMINLGLEWLFRLLKEPKRMWKRYLVGNTKFIKAIIIEKLQKS